MRIWFYVFLLLWNCLSAPFLFADGRIFPFCSSWCDDSGLSLGKEAFSSSDLVFNEALGALFIGADFSFHAYSRSDSFACLPRIFKNIFQDKKTDRKMVKIFIKSKEKANLNFIKKYSKLTKNTSNNALSLCYNT